VRLGALRVARVEQHARELELVPRRRRVALAAGTPRDVECLAQRVLGLRDAPEPDQGRAPCREERPDVGVLRAEGAPVSRKITPRLWRLISVLTASSPSSRRLASTARRMCGSASSASS